MKTKAKKRALITGLTGQDGSYLAEFLVKKGYLVYGLVRRTSTDPLARIEDFYRKNRDSLFLLNGDLRDSGAIERALIEAKPDEIYNLAAQSDVGISFSCPEETNEINYHGLGRLVHAAVKLAPKARIYQASTSEMFGASPSPQNEKTPFKPVSPYAESKYWAHIDYVVGYREKHNMFICSGILFNHESPRRGKHFVTRKITHSLAKVHLGLQKVLELGNLNSKRDWGYAGDYVEVMWRMLQEKKPQDFVIASGRQHTVREFVNAAAKELGMVITWKGKGVNEKGYDQNGELVVRVNPAFFRKNEVQDLLGDSRKARKLLKWDPKVSFEELVAMMVRSDIENVKRMHA
jgi:GDPmannose 4,6-dehydratase